MSNINALYQQTAAELDAINTHLAERRVIQAKAATGRLLALLVLIEEAEQSAIGRGDKYKSHAPKIKQSPAKACLDAGVKGLADDERVFGPQPTPNDYQIYQGSMKNFFNKAAGLPLEEEQAPRSTPVADGLLVAPSLKQTGERYGGMDI